MILLNKLFTRTRLCSELITLVNCEHIHHIRNKSVHITERSNKSKTKIREKSFKSITYSNGALDIALWNLKES